MCPTHAGLIPYDIEQGLLLHPLSAQQRRINPTAAAAPVANVRLWTNHFIRNRNGCTHRFSILCLSFFLSFFVRSRPYISHAMQKITLNKLCYCCWCCSLIKWTKWVSEMQAKKAIRTNRRKLITPQRNASHIQTDEVNQMSIFSINRYPVDLNLWCVITDGGVGDINTTVVWYRQLVQFDEQRSGSNWRSMVVV